MAIFKYYNPYKRPIFYNYYRPTYEKNHTPPYSVNYPHTPYTANEPSLQSENKIAETGNTFESNKSSSNVWLDLFGIKLYFDDILILSLLFFLYQEDVKDDGLFLALVLLLIS